MKPRRLSGPIWCAFGLAFLSSSRAEGLDVPLTVVAREATARTAAVVTSGVPFARGALTDPGLVRLLRGTVEVPLQAKRTASWPDGSVRWLQADFPIDLPAAPGSVALTLRTGSAPAPVSGVTVTDGATTLSVSTGATTHVFDKADLLVSGVRFEVVSGGVAYRARPETWVVEEPGPVRAVVRVEGRWSTAAGVFLGSDLVRFRARLSFWRGDAALRSTVTFQNRGAFCWDPEWACTRAPAIVVSRASFGATLLPSGPGYVVGQGAEKSWDVLFAADGASSLVETRFAANGALAPGSSPPAPLASPAPAWVAATGAWGRIGLPASGLPAERQADFDRFEKIQRAKVVAADVEDPPGRTGITVWGHLASDLASWNDYGDLRWAGNGCGTLSGNHYDWPFGMALQYLRTGRLAFADAARLFARHEEDLDVYHTAEDAPAYRFQKSWEDRASHDSPDNCFGGGRPTHTWTQGYALHWLLTGDRRGRDAFDELQEGIRQYLYEAFSGEGHVSTPEIRTHGWLVENLVARYRVDPAATLATSSYGTKTIPQAIKDVLSDVFAREAAAGGAGYTVWGETWDAGYPYQRSGLQHLYFLEPAIEAYVEVFKGSDAAYAADLLGLIQRMTAWLVSVSYGGDTNGDGLYRPLQVPYVLDVRQPVDGQLQGQVVYDLMLANALAFLSVETGSASDLAMARRLFADYVRYVGVVPGDEYVDPALRTPTSYNSAVFDGTESKVHGWSNRYGQWLLAAEAPRGGASFRTLTPCRLVDTRDPNGPFGGPALAGGATRSFALAGACGVPASARAASLNVTVTQPAASGSLTLYPGGEPLPTASAISFAAGRTRANNAVTALAADGSGTLAVHNASPGSAHLILDVSGWFE